MRNRGTLADVSRDIVIERYVRKLSDGEVIAFSKDAPHREVFAVRSILNQAPARDGYDAVARYFNEEISLRSLTYETQSLLWLAFERMQVNHGHEVREACRDNRQVSLF